METMQSPVSEMVTVTPEVASEMLRRNTRNRNIIPSVVKRYVAAMSEERWVPSSSMLAFGEDGALLDGQHRLLAVIESGVPQEFLVVRGLPRTAQDFMDTQARRTLAGQLSLDGEVNANTLGAAIRSAARWELGARGSSVFASNEIVGKPRQFPDTQEARAFLAEHPDLREAVALSGRLRNVGLAGKGASLAIWLTRRIDSTASDEFFDALHSGSRLEPNNPILVLRERLLTDSRDQRRRKPEWITLAEVFKAWNLWRDDRPGSSASVRWRSLGPGAEPFPEPK